MDFDPQTEMSQQLADQRNAALNDVARLRVTLKIAEQRIEALEKRVVELETPKRRRKAD